MVTTLYFTSLDDAIIAAKQWQADRYSFQLTATPVIVVHDKITWTYRLDIQPVKFAV